jgi:hypothetical protein
MRIKQILYELLDLFFPFLFFKLFLSLFLSFYLNDLSLMYISHGFIFVES